MENLNAEQVKKALECCSSSDGVFACESGCPYWGGDYDICPCVEEPNFIIKNALALINSQEQRIGELTEENERLRAENEIKTQKRANIFEIANAFERGRTDGVRKMQERLKAKAVGFPNYIGEVIAARWVDRIAEEMLEVAQRPEVLNDQSSGLSDPEGDRAEARKIKGNLR